MFGIPEKSLERAAWQAAGLDSADAWALTVYDIGARNGEAPVKALMVIIGWCLLFVFCWPLAVLAIVLWPLLWLLSLPFRMLSITFDAVFALLRTILFLPARLLGYRDGAARRS